MLFMARRLNRRVTEEPQVNLTPLIDVVFVILIMFIVITPLLELDRVQLADGKNDFTDLSTSVQQSSEIAIHVHRNNSVWFAGKLIKIEELVLALKQARQKQPNARAQLFHDKQAHFGTYQSVKNAAEEAGFKELDVILKPS